MEYGILIYEDNANLRDSLNSLLLLNNKYRIFGVFADCQQVEGQVQGFTPDIILMDIDMPYINGIEAVKKIRSFDKKVQIIMLTVFDDSEHVFLALKAGANGYLLKRHISDRLIQSIDDVLQGGAPMSPAIARMVISSMQTLENTKKDYRLTPREIGILQHLSKGKSVKMIAAVVDLSPETVRTHLKHIYEKLHVNSQTEAVSKAFNEKLV